MNPVILSERRKRNLHGSLSLWIMSNLSVFLRAIAQESILLSWSLLSFQECGSMRRELIIRMRHFLSAAEELMSSKAYLNSCMESTTNEGKVNARLQEAMNVIRRVSSEI